MRTLIEQEQQKAYMHYEHNKRMRYAHILHADIPESMSRNYDHQRERILSETLNLSNTDNVILTTLLKISKANVYRLSKTEGLARTRHYSTVLRALRRLGKWNLVHVLPESNTRRSEKIYALTLSGEYVALLVKGGWKEVARKLFQTSSKFQESVRAHRTINKYHYLNLALDTVFDLMHSLAYRNVKPDIEKSVDQAEYNWIAESIVSDLQSRATRAEALTNLRKLSHIDWIRSAIFSIIDDETANETEWLNLLVDFRRELKSAEMNAKLEQFTPTQN